MIKLFGTKHKLKFRQITDTSDFILECVKMF